MNCNSITLHVLFKGRLYKQALPQRNICLPPVCPTTFDKSWRRHWTTTPQPYTALRYIINCQILENKKRWPPSGPQETDGLENGFRFRATENAHCKRDRPPIRFCRSDTIRGETIESLSLSYSTRSVRSSCKTWCLTRLSVSWTSSCRPLDRPSRLQLSFFRTRRVPSMLNR